MRCLESKSLISSSGLQFITVFILIIAIILFGILKVLGGSELAAILSGISGYILGKGGVGITEKANTPDIPTKEDTSIFQTDTIDEISGFVVAEEPGGKEEDNRKKEEDDKFFPGVNQ
jgi:hypothetical protein